VLSLIIGPCIHLEKIKKTGTVMDRGLLMGVEEFANILGVGLGLLGYDFKFILDLRCCSEFMPEYNILGLVSSLSWVRVIDLIMDVWGNCSLVTKMVCCSGIVSVSWCPKFEYACPHKADQFGIKLDSINFVLMSSKIVCPWFSNHLID